MKAFLFLAGAILANFVTVGNLRSATVTNVPTPGSLALADYFQAQTAQLADACLSEIKTVEDWKTQRETYREQLREMLGLSPMPPRTELKPQITGQLDHGDFIVEKLHFQSMPQLYVTANLYRPKVVTKPLPAVLYVCGHGVVKSNGVSMGNKTSYQHHGEWFARHGYVCLTIDTIQLGELEGLHHGTHHLGMWWWNSRGYTPAGVEAWNGIRALDYLQSRPEVDGTRLGVTGRSGGGAYSWWIAALDERIKAAAPVAGITDLQNHVVDGVVQGHCDCMFMVNTYRWDYGQVAAMVAPRPLLICNTDKDSIFPLEGVNRVHAKARQVYRLYGAGEKLGLLITEGPHKDTQDLQVPVFRWFNRYLKGEEPLIAAAAEKFYPTTDLKVFSSLPKDERTTRIHETFVPLAATPAVPTDAGEWKRQRDELMRALTEKSFRGWPEQPAPFEVNEAFVVVRDGVRFAAYDFTSQEYVHLRMYVVDAERRRPERVTMRVLDEKNWPGWLAMMNEGFATELAHENDVARMFTNTPPAGAAHRPSQFATFKRGVKNNNTVLAFLAPRGVGLTAWNPTEKQKPHVQRRFMLLGQTLEGMRVWDIRRGAEMLKGLELLKDVPLEVEAEGSTAVNAIYAALFDKNVTRLKLQSPPATHRDGSDYLNVLRFLDVPQAAAMAAEKCELRISKADPKQWEFPRAVAARLKWPAGQIAVDAD